MMSAAGCSVLDSGSGDPKRRDVVLDILHDNHNVKNRLDLRDLSDATGPPDLRDWKRDSKWVFSGRRRF
jgi:hypothetical protein